MEILLLVLVLVAISGVAQKLLEPLQSPHPQDGKVVLVEKGLQQREVDLQSHVVRVLGRKQAKDRAVRIAAWETEGEHDHLHTHGMWFELWRELIFPLNLRSENFGRFIETNYQAVLPLRLHQQFLQGQAYSLHPV